MPELIRAIVNRLRKLVGDRRRAPRYPVHLEAELTLSISSPHAKTEVEKKTGQPPLKLAGYTRDISANGLALVVPAIRIGGQYITGENRTLEIMLRLPNEVIKLKAVPVRYRPLDEEGTDTGYLIGAQILGMGDEDRRCFNAYLQTLSATTMK